MDELVVGGHRVERAEGAEDADHGEGLRRGEQHHVALDGAADGEAAEQAGEGEQGA
ncbi:MAG: hypothetical protein R2701_02235 [Acidimicrobiales bacterium]